MRLSSQNVLFVSQEEQRASDTVLFTGENIDTAIESVDTSFFIGENNRKTNQLAPLGRRDYFYLDAFWRVNPPMYVIITFYRLYIKVKKLSKLWTLDTCMELFLVIFIPSNFETYSFA